MAGWTGRDVAALEKHIRELEEIGVKRPKSTPIFYRNAASLLTTADRIEVLGENSSGEIEFVLHAIGDELFVGSGLRSHRPQGRDHQRVAVEADVRQAGEPQDLEAVRMSRRIGTS